METQIENIIIFFKYTSKLELFLFFCIFIVLIYTKKMLVILFWAKMTSFKSKKFEKINDSSQKVLFAGDSTAVGTGAKERGDTLAGRFSHDFPYADVYNISRNGATTSDILKQFKLVSDIKFNLIILSTGGNDIWTFKTRNKIKKDLSNVLDKAIEISNHRVILVFFGNEGSAPFFPFLIRKILMWRTRVVNQIFIDVSIEKSVPLVELFSNRKENPFIENPKKYFAKDKLHPSSDGYWRWYKGIWYFMTERKYLFSDR